MFHIFILKVISRPDRLHPKVFCRELQEHHYPPSMVIKGWIKDSGAPLVMRKRGTG